MAYHPPNIPYYSQIDNIAAFVGCEAVAALGGLQAKGYAQGVTLRDFLNALPRTESDPEKGFVGSPYVKNPKLRTTIYPAALAAYCNIYCGGKDACADFRGAEPEALQRELLAGNWVVAYVTMYWGEPEYRTYRIEGKEESLIANNHALLVCGYDPDKGYFVSDPWNEGHHGEIYQYWQDAETFEKRWNLRKTGMVIR